MKYPERVNIEVRYRRWHLPPMGWLFVYTLAALFFGVMVYVIF